jgi:hypothetical protein
VAQLSPPQQINHHGEHRMGFRFSAQVYLFSAELILIHYFQDVRRRPKFSTVHGWLAKMRGTLLGDERLRSQGMREMREARALRRRKSEKKAAIQRKTRTGISVFSLFVSKPQARSKPSRRTAVSPRISHRSRHPDSTHHRFTNTLRYTSRRGLSSPQRSYNATRARARKR